MLCLIWLIFVWIWCLFVSKAGIQERQKFSFVSLLLQPGAMRCWNPSCEKKWLDLPLIVSQWWLASRNRCRSLLPLFLALFPKSCFSKIVSNKKKSSTSTTSTTEKKNGPELSSPSNESTRTGETPRSWDNPRRENKHSTNLLGFRSNHSGDFWGFWCSWISDCYRVEKRFPQDLEFFSMFNLKKNVGSQSFSLLGWFFGGMILRDNWKKMSSINYKFYSPTTMVILCDE